MRTAFCLLVAICGLAVSEQVSGQGSYQRFENAVPAVAKQLAQNAKDKAALSSGKVVVGEFPDSFDQILPFSRRLGEALIMELEQGKAFAGVVERSRLSQVLTEQGKTMSALYDEKDAPELGKLAGAKYMVLGSIAVSKAAIDVKLRLVATDTRVLQSTATVGVLNTEDLAPLLKPRQPPTVVPGSTPEPKPEDKTTTGKPVGDAKPAATTPPPEPKADVKPATTVTQAPAEAKTVTAEPTVAEAKPRDDKGTVMKPIGQAEDSDVAKPGAPDLKPYLLAGVVVLVVLAGLVAATKKKDAPTSAEPEPGAGAALGIVCGRCGGKIETDGQIAGQCMAAGCPTPICQACWAEHKDDRRCFQHTTG